MSRFAIDSLLGVVLHERGTLVTPLVIARVIRYCLVIEF
jgi:hypothetical protein